ncbi:MAG: hypothetical protein RL012_229 [Bacteroidota bacterium]|jgi:beta-lactam-binding protein with PASTA domain
MKLNRPFLKLIVLHLSLMAVVGSCVSFLFFNFLLPVLTHHGQFITVPNLQGISLEEVDAYLAQRNLRFEVTEEFSYEPDYPPMTVLQQYPKAGARVKEGRKIYLTLNTKTPPKVKMPDLVDGSVRNAHVRLKSHGLLLGAIKYIPDIAQNAVLEQWHQDKEIATGTLIAQGARIDLVVGAGLGNKMVEVPQLVGMKLGDAKLLLLSVGIQVGNIAYESATDQAPGTILGQHPDAGQQMRIGENVDIWLVARQEEEVVIPYVPMLPEN